MTSEVTKRNEILAALNAIVVERGDDAWDELTVAQRCASLVEAKSFPGAKAMEDIFEVNAVTDAVHAFVYWAENVPGLIAEPTNEYITVDAAIFIMLLTSNIDDPQGSMMATEQTIKDALKSVPLLEWIPTTSGRWESHPKRAILMLTMMYATDGLET